MTIVSDIKCINGTLIANESYIMVINFDTFPVITDKMNMKGMIGITVIDCMVHELQVK